MLVGMASKDMRMLGRGIMALVVIIAIGIMTTERQLNDMTQRQEFVQVLNIRRDEALGTYGFYALGHGFQVKAVYPVAGIDNTRQALTLTFRGYTATLPLELQFDLSRAAYWLALWRNQFVDEALKTKEILSGYFLEIKPQLQKIINSVKR